MNAREHVKNGARWLLVGIVGSLAGIGAVTLAFAWIGGSYTPASSSDLAAWIQAIGSIGTIAAAYALGERQARKAREHALEIYDLQRNRLESGGKAVVQQLYGEILATLQACKAPYVQFTNYWLRFQSHACKAALDAFDRFPRHELGTETRIMLSFEIRAAVEELTDRISHTLRAEINIQESRMWSEDEDASRLTFEEKSRMLSIRSFAEMAAKNGAERLSRFNATYEK
ncbi:hypothetical protein [Achromobacter insuavis]|uniref:hypothetical protein n=1 Tax=Achromobacter insuavis TaxID=1287735 RepID=UPI001F12DC18|nr:hypothetical protein [Achromobacter insuavis]